ncbi:uncharacterized protein [Rutidosis leptorrhynchoides]|uniref:uncharacterized protein n=1 Tax=Rutidosis leptorrhynchoides TaxID=125765 RepID=UPI003A9931AD
MGYGSSASLTTLMAERKELVVSLNGDDDDDDDEPCRLKTCNFLKPIADFTSDQLISVPPITKPTSDLQNLAHSVEFRGRQNPPNGWKAWVHRMLTKHHPTWEKAGIEKSILCSKYNNISMQNELILEIADKWCLKTDTFIFPWGEATVTLEDILVLVEFSVLGDCVLSNSGLDDDDMLRTKEALLECWESVAKNTSGNINCSHFSWICHFMRNETTELEHVAFLVLWLSMYRFPSLSPRPNLIESPGQPRMALWDNIHQFVDQDIGMAFDNAGRNFQWQRYVAALKFYREEDYKVLVGSEMDKEIESFVRCIRVSQLVGLDCSQEYNPNRVAMQFRLDQDIPFCLSGARTNTHHILRDYSRPIEDKELFVPSRFKRSVVSKRYFNWWNEFVLPRKDEMNKKDVMNYSVPKKRKAAWSVPSDGILKPSSNSENHAGQEPNFLNVAVLPSFGPNLEVVMEKQISKEKDQVDIQIETSPSQGKPIV